tara:strand:- start:36 stop:371 length:336 start_codon:yes stop_codon:yes gene_type:complete
MSTKSIGRLLLGAGIIACYSATIYTLGDDLQSTGRITINELPQSKAYSHSTADVQKIRSALNHDISGVTASSENTIPGAECIIYRNDIDSIEFHVEIAECIEPNLPVELVR